jgi:hypothetical protein
MEQANSKRSKEYIKKGRPSWTTGKNNPFHRAMSNQSRSNTSRKQNKLQRKLEEHQSDLTTRSML